MTPEHGSFHYVDLTTNVVVFHLIALVAFRLFSDGIFLLLIFLYFYFIFGSLCYYSRTIVLLAQKTHLICRLLLDFNLQSKLEVMY